MHKFVASLLIVALLGILMLTPAKSVAIAPVIVVPPVDPITVAINIAISLIIPLLKFFGVGGGPDCDKLISDFIKTPAAKTLSGGSAPFGGKISKKTECICEKKVNEVIVVGPPKAAIIGITGRSKIYDHKSLNLGNWVLGNTTSRKICNYPIAYEVDIIGTSR